MRWRSALYRRKAHADFADFFRTLVETLLVKHVADGLKEWNRVIGLATNTRFSQASRIISASSRIAA